MTYLQIKRLYYNYDFMKLGDMGCIVLHQNIFRDNKNADNYIGGIAKIVSWLAVVTQRVCRRSGDQWALTRCASRGSEFFQRKSDVSVFPTKNRRVGFSNEKSTCRLFQRKIDVSAFPTINQRVGFPNKKLMSVFSTRPPIWCIHGKKS